MYFNILNYCLNELPENIDSRERTLLSMLKICMQFNFFRVANIFHYNMRQTLYYITWCVCVVCVRVRVCVCVCTSVH